MPDIQLNEELLGQARTFIFKNGKQLDVGIIEINKKMIKVITGETLLKFKKAMNNKKPVNKILDDKTDYITINVDELERI